MRFVLFALLCILSLQKNNQAIQIVWDNNVDFNSDFFEQQLARGDQVKMPNRHLIYPGTKWCGAGNVADDEDDFGKYRNTDKCCRNHDLCVDTIQGFQSKYNLTNPVFYTRLSCECDEEFYRCLKSVSSESAADRVGIIYFSLLGTQCFREDYPIVDCAKYSYLPLRKCVEYELDENKDKIYQWFDVPNY